MRALLVSTVLLWSCGGDAKEPTASELPSTSGAEEARSARGGTHPHRELAHHGPGAHVGSPLRPRAAALPEHPDTRQLYGLMAPATVIVRTSHGMGTGVRLRPGLILTNRHVVQGAEEENFRLHVNVEEGRMNDTGSMVPTGETKRAWVLKVDAVHDLALLKVEDEDETASALAVATDDPTPGQPVTCMGHGNVGLVWAIRRCGVEATGRLEETYARLQAVCSSEDERAKHICQAMRERIHNQMNGLVLQTSCTVSPGDSGGPLVNDRGELVGLNVMTMRNELGQSTAIHIHAREIRAFVEDVPTKPESQLPTPWLASTLKKEALDQDLDGHWDSVSMVGPGREMATLFDLDQDSADFQLADLDEVLKEKRFDAEMALVSSHGRSYVWYDTTGDGHLDQLLEVVRRNEVKTSYIVTRAGDISTAPGDGRPAVDVVRVPAGSTNRFHAVFHDQQETHGEHPAPVPAMLRSGRLVDSDSDGRFDAIAADRALVHVIAYDADENALPAVQQSGIEEAVRGRLDFEATLIRRHGVLWAFYDTDDDGTMEFGVRSAPMSPVVTAAVPMQEGAAVDSAPLVGTLLLRPDRMGAHGEALGRMLQHHVPAAWIATDAKLSGLPHPTAQHQHALFHAHDEVRGWADAVVAMESRGVSTVLIDVNQDSFRGRNRRLKRDGVEAAARGGNFSADLAVVTMGPAVWVWYDADLDGAWDTVLVRVRDRQSVLRNAFSGGETMAYAPNLTDGKLLRPGLFPRRYRRKLSGLLTELFDPAELEN